jgi:hypothetical protein
MPVTPGSRRRPLNSDDWQSCVVPKHPRPGFLLFKIGFMRMIRVEWLRQES